MSINDYDRSPDANPTNPVEFDDYSAHVLEVLTKKDTYKNLKSITMKVVSPSVAASSNSMQFRSLDGIFGLDGVPFNSRQIMFRGRIIGDDFISPHQLLTDPCNVTKFKGDDESLLDVINQHTLCISKYSYNGPPLQIGDLVTVNIMPGDSGPLNLQFCYFDSIEEVISPELVAAKGTGDTCETLASKFGMSNAFGFGDFEMPDYYDTSAESQCANAKKVHPANLYDYEGTLAEAFAKGGILRASARRNDGLPSIDIEYFESPGPKGARITSFPQKNRLDPTGSGRRIDHQGVDIAYATGVTLYAPLPGWVFRGRNFKNIDRPNTSALAQIHIISVIDILDTTAEFNHIQGTYSIVQTLKHLSAYAPGTRDGDFVRQGQIVGNSGGAKNQMGSGPSTGPHLHWTYREKQGEESSVLGSSPSMPSFGEYLIADCTPLYMGRIRNPTNGSFTRSGSPTPESDAERREVSEAYVDKLAEDTFGESPQTYLDEHGNEVDADGLLIEDTSFESDVPEVFADEEFGETPLY